MKVAFLFPGQGSQVVGMGRDLYERHAVARDHLDLAERQSGLPLRQLCFDGPEDDLRATEVAQPAILAVSAMAWAVLDRAGVGPHVVAGHSLGEYTALVAAGVVSFEDGVALVRTRGLAMARAGAARRGAMAAIQGLTPEALRRVCDQVVADTGDLVVVANLNAADQLILSGSAEGVRAAMKGARAAGASKALPLPVSGAFHSPWMAPARDELVEALRGVRFRDARVPVVTNVDALPTTAAESFAPKLADQVLAPVRWSEVMDRIVGDGVDTFVEVGPGTVLGNLARKRAPEARHFQAGDAASVDQVIAALSG